MSEENKIEENAEAVDSEENNEENVNQDQDEKKEEEEQPEFTQSDVNRIVQQRLSKESKKLQKQWDEQLDEKIKERVETEKSRWQGDKKTDTSNSEEHSEEIKKILAQEEKRWDSRHKEEVTALDRENDSLKHDLAKEKEIVTSLKDRQKQELIENALRQANIGEDFLDMALTSLEKRVVYSDDHKDFLVLENPTDENSLVVDHRNKQHGYMTAKQYITTDWAETKTAKGLRTDISQGPGGPKGKTKTTSQKTALSGIDRIGNALQQQNL